MKRLTSLAVTFLTSVLMTLPASAASDTQPKIQIAILLDTSSSMDGLINQTRQQLWQIVNTFASAKKDGKAPKLELALYEYGNDRLDARGGYIRMVSGLTSNLDVVSEQLFALRTNGGSEHCGQVISRASQELEWSKVSGDLKLIYIAGNEPFTQGPVNYATAVKSAIEHGIVVNTIHAGNEADGVAGKWKEAALLADGNFMTIDQNAAVVQVVAPQDKEIARLGAELNKTYVGYGQAAPAAVARQAAQDSNAMDSGGVGTLAVRSMSKASANYDNSNWDLVDAKKAGKAPSKMAPAELPAALREMKAEERDAFVEAKAKDRAEIQAKIQALAGEREQFVKKEMKKRADTGPKTMDAALLESARAQGAKGNYTFAE